MSDFDKAEKLFSEEDQEYMTLIRRQLHRFPEGGFDTPKTLATVKSELEKNGIEYDDSLGLSSVVAWINKEKKDAFTIAVRADMDALPIKEQTGLPYASEHEGLMHACGHDAHTAILIGTARVLKRIGKDLNCRVKLIFQACEESAIDKRSGAELLCKDGVMEDVDVIIGLHSDNSIECGSVGLHHGPCSTNSNPITVKFHGASAHAVHPESGADALAMGVKFINDYQYLLTRRLDPRSVVASSICSFRTDNDSYNVVAGNATIKMTLRTYEDETNNFIEDQIRMIAGNVAAEMGGTAEVSAKINYPSSYNNEKLCDLMMGSMKKVVGEDRAFETPLNLGSEDFSFFSRIKPGVYFRLGTRNEKEGCTELVHSSCFRLDERALSVGAKIFVQFVLDNQNGIRF